jgi:D-erythrulose 1-phosphate 3-epimerase
MKMAEVTLGINNSFALKRWPEPMAWTRIIAEELKLKHVQFSFDLLDPTLPEPDRDLLCREVVQAASHYGLSLHTTFTGLIIYAQNHLAHPSPVVRARALEWFAAAIAVSGKLAAEGTGGHIGTMSAADFADTARRHTMRAAVVNAVRELAQVAAADGLRYFLWELMPLPREFPHTPEEAIEVMQEVNQGSALPVWLCFDLGHCGPFDGDRPEDPHLWLEKLLRWTPVIHLQQTDGKGDRHWPFTSQYAGVGIIDPQRVVEIARSSPFERVELIFEISHAFDAPDQQIIDDHKESVDTWARWL